MQALFDRLGPGRDTSVTVAVTDMEWLESLSPWPTGGVGTERMRELLDRLGNPQRTFEAVHVVGTKGKSTAARRIARTIGGAAYTPPPAAGWDERLHPRAHALQPSPRVGGWHARLATDAAGLEHAVARIRAAAEDVGATQFEAVTAAAFADFA